MDEIKEKGKKGAKLTIQDIVNTKKCPFVSFFANKLYLKNYFLQIRYVSF